MSSPSGRSHETAPDTAISAEDKPRAVRFNLLFLSGYIPLRSIPTVLAILLGLGAVVGGLIYGFVLVDQGQSQTVQINAVVQGYPDAQSYKVDAHNQLYVVQGHLADGTVVSQVVDHDDVKEGNFKVYARYHAGKTPEISTIPLSAEFPHQKAGRALMVAGAALFILGVIYAFILGAIIRRRRHRRSAASS